MTSKLILDHRGLPMQYDAKSLLARKTTPTKDGVLSVKTKSVALSLTPAKAAALIKSANEGNMFDYLTVAEEIEESSPHYGSVLSTRKRAVVGLEAVVTAASEDKKDLEISDTVKGFVNNSEFKGLMSDLLDGLAKGFSICEITYAMTANMWLPQYYKWVDPRSFTFDKESRSRPLLRQDDGDPIELEYGKFITHFPKLKSGIPIRGGLARLVLWSVMCSSFSARDWMAFIEVFGMPLRLGRYPSGTKPEDIAILAKAVAALASDSSAVIPESMNIEFVHAATAAKGDIIFEKAAKYFESLISKAVLGQTMTTEDGSSNAQANVHNEVRLDILESDADILASTIQRDLIDVFVFINYGADQKSPKISFPVIKAEDVAAITDALKNLVPLGLVVSMNEVRGRLGFSEPDKKDKVLSVGELNTEPKAAINRLSLNKVEQPVNADTLLDDLEADQYSDFVVATGSMVDKILAKFDAATSYAEVQKIIDEMDLSTLENNDFRTIMAESCTIARAIGDQHD
ncbi:MAG: DUF935 domain-containing protein [Rhizobiales bacterium]|nr:DUF935 domain-containing protein [Hyphomicrobiales bacterium]